MLIGSAAHQPSPNEAVPARQPNASGTFEGIDRHGSRASIREIEHGVRRSGFRKVRAIISAAVGLEKPFKLHLSLLEVEVRYHVSAIG